MSRWWSARRKKRQIDQASDEIRAQPPLREFVYLDAVSLQSLLISQNMTIPESVLSAAQRGSEAEASTSLSADALVGKGEVAARYQTSSSSSQETSRRALIQSSFKEFRELPLEFKLADSRESDMMLEKLADLPAAKPALSVPSSSLVRGDLIEVDVTLAVDPVYKLAAMMTEYGAMADEYPGMFEGGVLGFLRQSQPIVRVLQRFLAGLIPLRATATNIVAAEYEGREYLVDAKAIGQLDAHTRPVRIVGVTEQQNYWKDVRRVLFSDSRFRVLGRVARDGVHEKWTPVKLADLFSDVSPDFVDQINAIKSPSALSGAGVATSGELSPMVVALRHYRDFLLGKTDESTWAPQAELELVLMSGEAATATQQRSAFDRVRELALGEKENYADILAPEDDLAARRRAREDAGVPLFPSLGSQDATAASTPPVSGRGEERFLDIEVVAIYW